MKFIFPAFLTILLLFLHSCKDTENAVIRDISFQDRKIAEIYLDNMDNMGKLFTQAGS